MLDPAGEEPLVIAASPAASPYQPRSPGPAALLGTEAAPPLTTPTSPAVPGAPADAASPAELARPVRPPASPGVDPGAPETPPIDLEALRRAGLAVSGTDRTRVMEEWRVIASTLLRRQPKRQAGGGMGNALMVTSSRAREGKSFCSINLAATIASNRQAPTVLIDLDAKLNALSRLLGLSDRRGLLDLIDEPSLPISAVLVATAVPNLQILPLGGLAGSSVRGSEAGVTFPLIKTLERISRQLADRLIVLDTAPCLATGDAAALAPLIGQIAMVVEAEATQKNDIEAALALLTPCPLISLVLNKVRNQTSGHFGVETYGYDGRRR